MSKRLSTRRKAYSYLRFSTPEQMNGDSFRRQTEAATDYAEKHGLDLDTELTFRDLGISAYRGANVVEGALGQFMKAVDTGKVKPGSFLLVENLDRLSRDRIMPALNRFSALLEKGISIVTLSDGRTYTADSLNELPDLMMSLLVMSRAHEESKIKSDRLQAAWKNKRNRAANGDHIITAKAPAWLQLHNGKFGVVKARVAVVRRIFALALKGWGKAAIARQLNIDGVPTFGRADGWYQSYITKILRNEAVIGRFQPMKNTHDNGRKNRVADGEPIENYFPAIISESNFYKIKHSKPGPSGRGAALPVNVLTGIVFCKLCGGKMHFVNKGKGDTYLSCDNARRKKTCKARSVRYQPILNHVLDNLTDYRNMYELSLPSDQDRDRDIDAVQAQIAGAEEVIERLLDTLERVPSTSAEKRLAKHESRLAVLQAQKVEIQEKRAIRKAEGVPDDDYVAWYKRVVDPNEATEIMLGAIAHLGAEIRRTVEKIVLEKGTPIQVVPRSGV